MYEFVYVFVLSLAVWAMAILAAWKFKFLSLPVIVINLVFFIHVVISNSFPEWQTYFIAQIIVTIAFAILALIGD